MPDLSEVFGDACHNYHALDASFEHDDGVEVDLDSFPDDRIS